jgi:hypothetical protein
MTLPVSRRDGRGDRQIVWRLPVYHTILRILQNPTYAGAYAFGRTGTRTHVEEGQVHKSRAHHRAIDEWIVLLRDHHEPYISGRATSATSRCWPTTRTSGGRWRKARCDEGRACWLVSCDAASAAGACTSFRAGAGPRAMRVSGAS